MATLWCPILCFFYGAGRPNCYILPQHVPSIIQAIVSVVPDLCSLLCLLTGNGDPDGDPEGSNPRDIKVRARAGGYGGLVMPTLLMTLCILSCSTHTESPTGTQILLALPL
jgi:hypothetical protein